MCGTWVPDDRVSISFSELQQKAAQLLGPLPENDITASVSSNCFVWPPFKGAKVWLWDPIRYNTCVEVTFTDERIVHLSAGEFMAIEDFSVWLEQLRILRSV